MSYCRHFRVSRSCSVARWVHAGFIMVVKSGSSVDERAEELIICPATVIQFIVYGTYDYSCHIREDEISVDVERSASYLTYKRVCRGESAERTIASENGAITINPVEPLNLPKEVTRNLEVHFKPIFIEPEVTRQFFLTFPVEIGVFIRAKGDYDLLDVFSPAKPKYSLYGPPDYGCVTRWHESAIHSGIPDTNPLREGVLDLTIVNEGRTWIEVSRAVFVNAGMTIWYGDYVWMSARMELFSNIVAETKILQAPEKPGMTRSLPAYSAKKVSVVEMVNQIPFYSTRKAFLPEKTGFLMEFGLGDKDDGL